MRVTRDLLFIYFIFLQRFQLHCAFIPKSYSILVRNELEELEKMDSFKLRPFLRSRIQLQIQQSNGEVNLENNAKTNHDVTVIELLKFGLPTLGIWLLQPILSLIDSSVIGMSSSSMSSISELAALGPSIIWCDGTAYLFQFMGMATTNLFAVALSQGDKEKSLNVLSQAIMIAAVLGTILGVVQFSFARNVLTRLTGPSAAEVVPFGVDYVKIRAFGAPAALLTIVGQAAFLASKDAVTPLQAVLFGTVINFFGDIFFVLVLKRGIAGAAFATMLSQVGGGLYLLGVVLYRLKKGIIRPSTSENSKSLLKIIPSMMKIPTVSDTLKFMSFAGPLFFVLFWKQILWTYATVCAASYGTVALAAHQIIINLLLFFCIFGDAISQMSQTFIPPLFHKQNVIPVVDDITTTTKVTTPTTTIATTTTTDNHHSSNIQTHKSLTTTITRILSIGLYVGLANTVFSFILPYLIPQLFTKSLPVISAMKDILPLLTLCLFPHCMMSAMEGVLIGTGDALSLSLFYIIAGVAFTVFQAFAKSKRLGLQFVWIGLALYQYLRLFLFGSKVWINIFRQKKSSNHRLEDAVLLL